MANSTIMIISRVKIAISWSLLNIFLLMLQNVKVNIIIMVSTRYRPSWAVKQTKYWSPIGEGFKTSMCDRFFLLTPALYNLDFFFQQQIFQKLNPLLVDYKFNFKAYYHLSSPSFLGYCIDFKHTFLILSVSTTSLISDFIL